MSVHLERAIERLKKRVLSLATIVEESVSAGVHAIEERDEAQAREVMENDARIDQYEVEVEEECLKILALHQPVAIDLRFIIAVLKINSDLERIGDLAVNIAERAAFLATKKRVRIPFVFSTMYKRPRICSEKALMHWPV